MIEEFVGEVMVTPPDLKKYDFSWSGSKNNNEAINWPDVLQRRIYKTLILNSLDKKENRPELRVMRGG